MKYECFSCDDFSPCALTVHKDADTPTCCPYTRDVNKATWEKVKMKNQEIINKVCKEIERFKKFADDLEREGRPVAYILHILKQHIQTKLEK